MGRITAKSQTTIPRAVRAALDLLPGDSVAYEIEGDSVRLRKVSVGRTDGFTGNLSAFDEWADPLDDAYDAL